MRYLILKLKDLGCFINEGSNLVHIIKDYFFDLFTSSNLTNMKSILGAI